MTAALRFLVRKFYLLCAIALITLAVLVQAGRSLSPLLNDYRQNLADYISGELNAKVTLGAVQAEWEGLKPVLDVRDLNIVSHSDSPIVAFARARLRLDLLRSLWNWQLVWSSVTLQDTALEFEQTAKGFWRIPGLPEDNQKTPQAAQLDVLVDMLLLANKIEFQRTQLFFRFANSHQIALNSPSLLLENQNDFHRLSLALDIEERAQAVSLVVEGKGDPRDQQNFHASGYLEMNEFPTSEPLAAATALLLGSNNPTQLRSEGALNARLWFTTQADKKGVDISGDLALQTLLVPLFEKSYKLDSFSTGVKGYWLRSGDWRLALPGINAGLQDALIDKVNLAISGAGAQTPLQIQMDHLQVAAWTAVLNESGVLREGALRDILARLEPAGELRNVHISLPLNNPKGWQLEARAEQLAVKALGGVPALTGVDGYVKAGQAGGFINLDSHNGFSMHFDPVYREAMHYDSVSGQVAWHLLPEKNEIYVNSGAIHFRSANEEATGYLWLNLPWQRNTGDIDLYLHIGARNLNVSLYSKYLPALVAQPLTNWLAQSLGENNSGSVSEAGFVYRGTLNTPNAMARSHQLYLEVEHAQLAYHADWPELTEVNGRFLLDDNNVDASVTSAKLYDSKVLTAQLTTRPNPDGEGALLTVRGALEGSVEDGLRVLRESQLRQYVGPALDTWAMTGSLLADIDIAVPLAAGADGAAQRIDIALDVSSAEIGDLRLSLQDISGRISYDHDKGFASDNLQGVLFGESVSAQISSQRAGDADSTTLIELTGAAPAPSLASWTKRPELLFLEGTVPYSTAIELIHRRRVENGETVGGGPASNLLVARVKASSDLTDVALTLPAPYGKSAKTKRALEMDLEVREQTATLTVDYRRKEQLLTQAQFVLQRHGNHLLNANIALGEQTYLQSEPGFLVSGYLPSLALEDWQDVQQRYVEYAARIAPGELATAPKPPAESVRSAAGFIADLPLRAKITLGSHQLGPLQLEDLALEAWQRDQVWHLRFANPMLTGALQMPLDKSAPVLIALEELHLNRAPPEDVNDEGVAAEPGALVEEVPGFNPRNLPRANVTLDALYVDGINYGNWSLQVHPDHRGALFDNIYGMVNGLTVAGIQPRSRENGVPAPPNRKGAQMYWLVDEAGARTRFIGSLTAADMAGVLQAWRKPDIIESSSASYQVDLTWPGSPGELALTKLQGDIDLLLQEGRFKRDSGAGEGILRLFALLNFDSIARRLRLDFSDLYKGGLTYDKVQGRVSFDEGKIYFVEPLMVESPSSRLQLAGSINLHDETIDTRLVAALPVAGNLTFLAAFATGLPAAVGIYLVSKIFRKQVDQATSVSYSITGTWDEPKMKFDRLFESEESLRSSVNQQANDDSSSPASENEGSPAPVSDDVER